MVNLCGYLVVQNKIIMKNIKQKNNPCGKVFTLKTYSADLYKWSPRCPDFSSSNENRSKITQNNRNDKPFYCSAISGSQGQDWITTYVYTLALVANQQERLAYVECDYVM
jgi:hypothetical protein